MRTESVRLSDDELVRLDHHCRADVQAIVELARARIAEVSAHPELSPADAGFIADTRAKALEHGRLIFEYRSIRSCDVCSKVAGYATCRRSSRKVFGPKKGQLDYSRPLHMSGVNMIYSFVTLAGHATHGCCFECFTRVRAALAAALSDVKVEVAPAITGHPSKWIKVNRKHCKKCGWTGHEQEMRQKSAVFGGFYRGGCPQCPAENGLFVSDIETADGHVILPVPVVECEDAHSAAREPEASAK